MGPKESRDEWEERGDLVISIKIGMTTDPDQRKRQLQGKHGKLEILRLVQVANSRESESYLHAFFASKWDKTKGGREWFNLCRFDADDGFEMVPLNELKLQALRALEEPMRAYGEAVRERRIAEEASKREEEFRKRAEAKRREALRTMGGKFKWHRERLGLTQSELAQEIGVWTHSVMQIEAGYTPDWMDQRCARIFDLFLEVNPQEG